MHTVGRTVKPGRQEIILNQPVRNNDTFLRDASAMRVDLSMLGSMFRQKFGELLGEPVCVYGFEKTLSA